jgi:hypothetical protein
VPGARGKTARGRSNARVFFVPGPVNRPARDAAMDPPRRRVTFAPLPRRRRRLGLYPLALPWAILAIVVGARALLRG